MARKTDSVKKGPPRAQSPELAGGAGFTFEGAVSAFYLTALLEEGYAPGVENRTVCRVAFQQRNFGEPLDDVIIDFLSATGEITRLGLQVKSSLVISAAKTNTSFREVIRDSWATFQKTNFRTGIDRYGAAVGEIAKSKARTLVSLCELARESVTVSHFETRFAKGGNASTAMKLVKKDIVTLLNEAKGSACSGLEIHQFLSHLVLVQFDFLHDGASDPPTVMTRLSDCLAADQAGQATQLWATLCLMARESAGKSGEFYRPRLVRELSHIMDLRTAPSLLKDLEQLTELTRNWIEDIQNDVGGTHLDRTSLSGKLSDSLKVARFVQIRGLPGSGKSVLLRQRVEADLERGTVLFLKSDRLEGKGWTSFATTNGLSNAPLANLLTEIGGTGSDTLYIDGIDRIEKEHQSIVLDVIRTIFSTPLLSDWKIVVSLRDSGIEPLRNWLGELLNTMGVASIDVGALNDDEAEVLAKAKPQLRTLLFASAQVRDIVRRPFFAKILSQGFGTGNSSLPFEPQSEVDLIGNWWARGGYNANLEEAIKRQRAIIEIGEIHARQLSQPISLRQLTNTTISLIAQLVEDGIFQYVKQGHTVRFAHDIFFEWSFFHVLTDRENEWLEEIRECGEPPAVARVVELMSQSEYREGQKWADTLRLVTSSEMRSQWTRSWLLGPLAASTFEKGVTQFVDVITHDEFHFLKKALVWFQAEKTTPNSIVLAGELPQDQRIRIADILSWPSDYAAWRRFINFLLARTDSIPVTLYPEIVSVFEVWQNALAGVKNHVSLGIVIKCSDWLREIDMLNTTKMPTKVSRWKSLEEPGNFRQSLSVLILRSAETMPELASEYLKRIMGTEQLRENKFSEIINFSPVLANTHPQPLVDLTLKYLKKELPDDLVALELKKKQQSAELREKALAKPEAERTPRDELIIGGAFSSFGFIQFSYHDWETLSIENDFRNFSPPSPLREPFHSLFKTSPEQAFRLFNLLCNHAVTAWRQLHAHQHDSPGNPLPLEIQFPWGSQQFWGGDREYLWYRAMWVPKALACGFMALEEWCFAELEQGRQIDSLIHQIVEGNQSIAILGVASMLALHTKRLSNTVFPIVMAQRLWSADRNRMRQNFDSSNSNLMGFSSPSELPHIEVITTANARNVQGDDLQWLAQHYVLSEEFGEQAREIILGFKDELPYQIEEHLDIPEAREHLTKQALEYAEIANTKNYWATKSANQDGMVEVMHVSPSTSKPENIAKAEKAQLTLQEGSLWAWASQAFENGEVDDPQKIPVAIELARKLDSELLYRSGYNEGNIRMRRGAVTATAALILHFREKRTVTELTWARNILTRAIKMPETYDVYWTALAIIPWHQGIFASHGLAADLRHETADAQTATALLTLVSHPLEAVSLAALGQLVDLWDVDAKLAWAALQLAFTLCLIEPRLPSQPRGPSEPIHSTEHVQNALKATVRYYQSEKGWPNLPLPPPAWIKAESSTELRQYRESDSDEDDLSDSNETWTEQSTHWYSQYASKVLKCVPYEQILASDAKEKLLTFIAEILKWTNAKNTPPWVKKGRRNRNTSELFEWTHELGETLGRISGILPLAEVKPRFLEPILDLEDDACWVLLKGFVSTHICRYVYDALTVTEDAIVVLSMCLDRFLKAQNFIRSSYRSGEFSGFDEPRLVEILMFVSIEHASLASRYVNNDWSEIEVILPLVDRFIRAGGWSSKVTSHFLTLCERSKDAYPAEIFADQILAVIGVGSEPLKGWHGTLIPARIAGLIQHFAARDTPLTTSLGQKLLRILDLLVDMGDRRSAALQLSESFRKIKNG